MKTKQADTRIGWRRCGVLSVAVAIVATGGLVSATASAKPPRGGRDQVRIEKGVDQPKGAAAMRRQLGPSAAKTPVDLKGPKPVIKPENDTHDFGAVWVGPTLNHSFKITNEGETTLQIKKVKPSCGCTIAGEYPRKLEPGETGEFPFALRSAKLRGKFQKSITITSNDPITERLRLTLKGEVKRYVDVSPTSASFGRITDQESHVRELTISNNTETPLALTLKKPNDDKFDYELIEKEPGKRYGLRVTAKPPFTPGSLRSTLKLETNIEKQKEVEIRAIGTVPPRLEVQPASVIVRKRAAGSNPNSEGIARVLRFTNYGKNKVRLLEAKVNDPTIGVNIRERKEGQAYTVEVKLPTGYTPPLEGRVITLKTDDPEKPEILVPIRGTTRPPTTKTADRTPPKKQDDLIGKPAPEFSLTTIDGKALSNETAADQVTVLNFFAPNCGFCKKQIPRLEKVRAEYESKGVRFVNVSQKMRKDFTQDQVVDTIKGLGFHGELAINHDNTVGRKFAATGFPTMIVLGKTGKVEAKNVGNVGDLETRLGAQLDALLEGKPIPDTAMAAPPKPASKRVDASDVIGKPAPEFSLKTLEGKDVSNAALASAPVTVLNFFAANCGFCKKQIPRLEKVRKDYEGKGVRFINVAETMRKEYSEEEVVKTLKDLGWGDEVARDPKNEVGPKFGATGFPTMVVLGKNGKVEAVNRGNIGDLETRLKGQIDALLAGKSVPTVAQAPPKPPSGDTPLAKQVNSTGPVGKPAPNFSLKTLEGKDVSNAALASAPVTVLNFFAANCGFCKKQIPRLEKIRKDYEGKGVRFINVAETMRKEYTEEEIVKTLKDLGWGDEVARDPKNEIGPKFGATGFPTMVVLGKSGKVEAVNRGNIGDLETRVKSQIDALLTGKPIPAAAEAAAQPSKPRPPRVDPASLVGKPAPKFSLKTLEGKEVSNATLADAPATVLNFFACNCGYCGKQIPRLEKVRKEYEGKGIRFINVAETMRQEFSEKDVLDKMKLFGWGDEVARDPKNEVGPPFGATGFPTMIVLGKSGNVEAVTRGNVGDLETRVKGQLDALLAGKPIPVALTKPPARQQRASAQDLVGRPAPAFSLKTVDGKTVSNSEFANSKATVLDFFATNCGYCKKQIPRLETVRKEYESKGVRFVNVAQTMRKEATQEETLEILKGLGWGGEAVYEPKNKTGAQFNATGFPTMIVVGKNGKIQAVNIGNIGDLETKLKSQLDTLIAGKELAQAPAAPTPRRRPAEDLVGTPAPQFSLKTLDGKTVSSSEFSSHPATVLNFVAPNCGFCKRQVPNVEKVRAEYEAKGVRFVNMAMTMRKEFSETEIADVFKGVGSKIEIAKDAGNKIGTEYKAQSFPTMIVVGKDGKIQHVNIGAKPDIESVLKGQLDAMINGGK